MTQSKPDLPALPRPPVRRQTAEEKAAQQDEIAAARENAAALNKILAPNPEDLAKYESFLRNPDAGIFRLFPHFDCTSKGIIRVDGDCANFIPGAWLYSFRQKNYANFDFFDVRLKNGNLIGDGFLSQGILVELSDVGLEDVALTGKGLKFLVDFQPATTIPNIESQFAEVAKGIKADGYSYAKSVKANENMTYAARLVAYRSEIKNPDKFYGSHPAEARKYKALGFDKRADLIIAFRIVREDADGNVTILWKKLREQESAKITLK